MCFPTPRISIPPPPPAPAAQPPTPEELEPRKILTQLLQENLAEIRRGRAEDVQARAEFEKAIGGPLPGFFAKQAAGQAELADLVRAAQARQAATEERLLPLQERALTGQIQAHERDLASREEAFKQIAEQRAKFKEAVGMTPEESEAEEAARGLRLSRALGERFEKATKGELPVSPGLERALGEEEERIREGLFRQVGPGYELGDIGLRTIREFRKRAEELREGSRRGAISEAEQFGYALSPALLRVTQPREQARAGAVGLPGYVDQFGRRTGAGLQVAGLFRPGMTETPTQLNQLYQMLTADRALRTRADELAYGGELNYQNLLTQASAQRAGFRAARTQAMIQGLFGIAGVAARATPWGSLFGGSPGGGSPGQGWYE